MVKEGSSDYKKVRKRWFFKEPLTQQFFVEPKMVLLWHRCEESFGAPLFLRVYVYLKLCIMSTCVTCLFMMNRLLFSTFVALDKSIG